MPGDNFGRRVSRAASVGGGRAYRRETPVGWYLTILLICALGVALVTYSRYERAHATTTVAAIVPPTKANMWEAGLDLDICNRIEQLPATVTPGQAFITNGHGVVTIEPALASQPTQFSGKNAVLNTFLIENGVSLTASTLSVPSPTTTTTTTVPKHSAGSTTSTSTTSTSTTSTSTTTTTTAKTTKGSSSSTTSTSTSTTTTTTPPKPRFYSNGGRCKGHKAVVEVKVWKSPSAKTGALVSNPTGLRFKDGQLITIAFVPKGTNIPKPTSAHAVAAFLISNPGGVAPANVSGSTLGPLPAPPRPRTGWQSGTRTVY